MRIGLAGRKSVNASSSRRVRSRTEGLETSTVSDDLARRSLGLDDQVALKRTLEYKRDLSSPEGVLRTFVAFANTAGGTLLISVENETKRIRGIQDVLGAEEKIANIISDGIRPRLIPDIEIIPWRKLQLIAVQIYPSNTRPHHLVRLGPEDGVFIRVGSTNRRADQTQIEELRRLNRIDSFDEQPLPEASLEDFDVQAVREAFASIRQLSPAAFRTLRLTTEYQGKSIPTIGGILLFGKDRLQRFPDAWVKAGRFKGIDRAQLSDALSRVRRCALRCLAIGSKSTTPGCCHSD
jgi:ATP-dependent DNA helicase RecG